MTLNRMRIQHVIANGITGLGYTCITVVLVLAFICAIVWAAQGGGYDVLQPSVVPAATDDSRQASLSSPIVKVLLSILTITIALVTIAILVVLPYLIGRFYNRWIRHLFRLVKKPVTVWLLFAVKIILLLVIFGLFTVMAIGANLQVSYELVIFGAVVTGLGAVLFTSQLLYIGIMKQHTDATLW